MIYCYVKKGNRLTVMEGLENLKDIEDIKSVIWIDMFLPTVEEVKTIESIFDMSFLQNKRVKKLSLVLDTGKKQIELK